MTKHSKTYEQLTRFISHDMRMSHVYQPVMLREVLHHERRSGSHKVHSDTKRQIGMFLAYGFGALLAGIMAGPALPVLAWIPMLAVVTALICCETAIKAESSLP
jgi:hypothetical protein